MKLRRTLVGVCAANAASAVAFPIPFEAGQHDQLSTTRQTPVGSNLAVLAGTSIASNPHKREPASSTSLRHQVTPLVRRSQPTPRRKQYYRDMDCPAPHMRHPSNGSCRTQDQHDNAKREAEWLTLFATTAGAAASLYAEVKCIKLLDIKREEAQRKMN